MVYIVKDEQGHPIIHKGSNVVGCDIFEGEEIRDFEDKSKSFFAVASAESPDRFKDCIMVKGWQLKDYRKNAVLLMAHIYSRHPVGRSLEEFTDEKKGVKRLMFRPQFHGLDEESRLLYSLFKSKYISGFSVGFLPIKSEKIEQDDKKKEEDDHFFCHNPTRFLKQTLLEISCCPVPAHQDALSEIKSLVKKGSLYIPARYLQEKQVPEVETYDDYIHVKVEDEGRFKSLHEDEVTEGIVRVFGDDEGEFIDHKFIFSRKLFDEEKVKDLAKKMADDAYSGDSKIYDPEKYTARETVLMEAFPVLDEKAFAVKEKRQELETATNMNVDDNSAGDDQSVEEGEECEHCSDELGREYVIGKDMDFDEDEYIDEKDIEEKPFPNEHACRLLPPGDFDRFARKNCFRRSGGKCVDFIFGIKAGKSKTQAMRYKKDVWTASAARSHCGGADGSFEAAGKSMDVPAIKEYVKDQWGRQITDETAERLLVLSEKMDLDIVKMVLDAIDGMRGSLKVSSKIEDDSVQNNTDSTEVVDDSTDNDEVEEENVDDDAVDNTLDAETAQILSALKLQSEELRTTMEKIIDEVVERVVRAVKATFEEMRKKEINGDETIDPDVEEGLEDEDLDDEDFNDDNESEETDADEDVDAEMEEDEIAAAVSDSLREALGRLD